jgi:hypothetical protein
MLGSGGSKAAAPATGAVAPGSLRSLDDEWLRNGGTPLI